MQKPRIEYRLSYLNSLAGIGYLHYSHEPYDVAVLHDGKRVVVKPIIEVLPNQGFFNFKGKSYFLRDFAHNDGSNQIPDWALEWVNDRICQKPFKVDARMSHEDRFMLDGAIKRRKQEALDKVNRLDQF